MTDAVIGGAAPTPIGGKPGGTLARIHPVDLHPHVIRSLIGRTGVSPRPRAMKSAAPSGKPTSRGVACARGLCPTGTRARAPVSCGLRADLGMSRVREARRPIAPFDAIKGGSGPRRRAEAAVTGRDPAGPARQEPGCALPPVQSATHGHQPPGQTSCEFRAYRLTPVTSARSAYLNSTGQVAD
jgi:hypothetical protein